VLGEHIGSTARSSAAEVGQLVLFPVRQQTLAEQTGFEKYWRKSKREGFLEEMEQVVSAKCKHHQDDPRPWAVACNASKFLGRFYDERDAALAYDAAARAAFGEFAFCDFPLQEIAHLP
jgi:hypothetical protein